MKPTSSHHLVGILWTLIACFLFGSAGTVVRLGVTAGAHTLTVMVVKTLFATVIAWTIAGQIPRLTRDIAWKMFLLALAAGTSGWCMLEGYARLGVAPVAIILALYPAIVGFYVWILDKKRPAGMWFVSLGTAFIGVLLAMIGPRSGTGRWWEYLFPIVCAFTLAANDLLVQRVVVNTPPSVAIGWINLFTAITTFVVAPRLIAGHITELPSIVTGLGLGVMLFLALQLKFTAIAQIGPRIVSLLATSQPILALIVAALVLNEWLSPRQMVGVALVVVALILVTQLKEEPATRMTE